MSHNSCSDSKVITCKAAVCWGAGEPLKVEEIRVDPPKSSEIRVKMLYASLCHTDILYYKGIPISLYPRVLGHEGVGVVESIGDEVQDLKEGDMVIPALLGECKECENCKSNNTNLCLKYPLSFNGLMPDGTSRMWTVGGQSLYHAFSCSTWSEYMVIDANYVVKIDPSLDLKHASFLSCGFSTGFGLAWKEAEVERGSSVAVLGLGAVGLGAIEGARIQGAGRIIGIDKNEKKREKGEVFGMTDFINPNQFDVPISQIIKELTSGFGVDYCFECTGSAPLITEALLSTKMGKGKTIMVGGGHDPIVPINVFPILCGVTLKGSIFGGLKIKSDLPTIFHKCKSKELHLDKLLTHEVDLKDMDKALQIVQQPECVKILIKF